MSEELRAREVLAQFCDRDGHPETARILRSSEALNAESGGRTCIDAMLSFASSAAAQREGWSDQLRALLEQNVPVGTVDARTRDAIIANVIGKVGCASPSAPEERRDDVALAEAQKTIRDALMDSQYLAGVTAGWNAANSDDPEAALVALQQSRRGHLEGFAEAKAVIAALAPVPGER